MGFDENRIRFHSRMMRVATSLHASVEDGGEVYRDMVYSAYVNAGAPKDVDGWLREHMASQFSAVDEPPRWIEAEPSWPFHEGHPMIFVTQYGVPNTDTARRVGSAGQTLYVFVCRVATDTGFTLKHEIVTQW